MRIKILALSTAAALALSGCGETLLEQTLIGGAVGATAASATNSDPVAGALVGATGNVVYCRRFADNC